MRVAVVGIAFVCVAGCRGGHASDTAAARTDPSIAKGIAQRLAGCYLLQSGNAAPYRLQLASGGQAHLLDPHFTANVAGDEWQWSAQSDSAFVISWSGIDSMMEFNVYRRAGRWMADLVASNATGSDHLTAIVHKVHCPAPGA